jgi:hypothetical protein
MKYNYLINIIYFFKILYIIFYKNYYKYFLFELKIKIKSIINELYIILSFIDIFRIY